MTASLCIAYSAALWAEKDLRRETFFLMSRKVLIIANRKSIGTVCLALWHMPWPLSLLLPSNERLPGGGSKPS